jgi:hypothetical protein
MSMVFKAMRFLFWITCKILNLHMWTQEFTLIGVSRVIIYLYFITFEILGGHSIEAQN